MCIFRGRNVLKKKKKVSLFCSGFSPVLSVQRVLVSVGNPGAGFFISLLLFLFLFLGQRPFEVLDHTFFLFLRPVALDFLKRESRSETRFKNESSIRNKNLQNPSLYLSCDHFDVAVWPTTRSDHRLKCIQHHG